mmetsp:Transcript_68879/g.186121  ORF Transcript_68879/g.186121 Transcript_68879/m.186121 type:complete len:134 (-) Transcript_68879:72-473(-)
MLPLWPRPVLTQGTTRAIRSKKEQHSEDLPRETSTMATFRTALLALLALPVALSQISSKQCADNCFTVSCAPYDYNCMWLCLQGCPKGHVGRGPILKLSDLDDETRQRAIREMEEDQQKALAVKQKRKRTEEQ